VDCSATAQNPNTDIESEVKLRRVIGLPLLVLYGLGVTIGAGIYVLIGTTTARAGVFAPTSFLVASFVMIFSACSFAELSSRIPRSAGEAIYVAAGFKRDWLTLLTGLGVILSAIVAAATIGLGCAGYLNAVLETISGGAIAIPRPFIVLTIIGAMGLIATRGIHESVIFAAILTALEVIGLLIIIGAGYLEHPALLQEIPSVIPSFWNGEAWLGVFNASLIAFFAFIGFDDTVNLVEETKDPTRVMPLAIGITLCFVTIIYFFVTLVAVTTLGADELASSEAPLGKLFKELTGFSPLVISLIAVFATLNGIVIQIIMAARVMYGLGVEGRLPKYLAKVHPVTRVPRNATVLVTIAVLIFAVLVPLEQLAELTSQFILAVFTLVNLALVRIKLRHEPADEGVFTVPVIIPIIGAVTCLCLLFGSLLLA